MSARLLKRRRSDQLRPASRGSHSFLFLFNFVHPRIAHFDRSRRPRPRRSAKAIEAYESPGTEPFRVQNETECGFAYRRTDPEGDSVGEPEWLRLLLGRAGTGSEGESRDEGNHPKHTNASFPVKRRANRHDSRRTDQDYTKRSGTRKRIRTAPVALVLCVSRGRRSKQGAGLAGVPSCFRSPGDSYRGDAAVSCAMLEAEASP